MSTKPLPLGWLRGPIIDPKTGLPTPAFMRWMQDLESKTGPVLNVQGQIQAGAPVAGRTEGIGTTVTGLAATGDILAATKVVGRTEGIGTTVQQLNSTGQLLNTDQIAADGTGSPLTGGKRGFQALDTNNRLANSFRANAVNTANSPTSATTLSNDGVSTSITIAASTSQFGAGPVSYNSGSVDPGSFVKSFITATDPTFAGGAVAYAFTATAENQVNSDGKVPFGSITTVNGTAKTGGGKTGGSGGQAGGRGVLQ